MRDYSNAHKIKLKARALDHPLRQKIIQLIEDHNNSITVTDIYIKMRLAQSICSMHLAILRRAGFISPDREGKFQYYSVNTEYLNGFLESVGYLVEPVEK